MANEYVTTTELKARFGIEDDVDTPAIATAVEAASRAVDGYCGRRFFKDTTATARRFRADDSIVLDVQDFWDTATLVVETDDNADGTFETTWASTDYQVEPLNADVTGFPWRQIMAIDRYRWPMLSGPRAIVRITAKWGWTAVPADVKEAVYIQASRVFRRKDSPFGVAGSPEFGAIRMLASRLDPDVQVMLNPYLPAGQGRPGTARIG